ncbi:Uncharacterized protein FWK35_00015450 [Aphis craccivora]|uniref:Retroviral polymerase SH3-like domain-containing protein n=1 Tax=Aphis craccivora TaxID=307492 RepID=A0A6G0Y0C4_APHCR|nr:Uncharacterized protein FWK35_00015450 [Aphis craccivora]
MESSEADTVGVLAAFSVNPHASTKSVARCTNISRSTIHRILKSNSYRPFKLHYVHGLKPSDPERRLLFISKIVCFHDQDNDILSKIIWTDESRFDNNGIINRHNFHFWNETNPTWTRETNAQVRCSVNVWCGILNNTLIGSYFYDGTLTGQRYLEFLQNILPLLMDCIPLQIRTNMWLQQDGAPPHNANMVKHSLNQHFPQRWLGTNGPLQWPPQQSTSLDDLKERITSACKTVTSEMLSQSRHQYYSDMKNVKEPEIKHLRVFGKNVFTHIPQQKRQKWDPKNEKGIFVGYVENKYP